MTEYKFSLRKKDSIVLELLDVSVLLSLYYGMLHCAYLDKVTTQDIILTTFVGNAVNIIYTLCISFSLIPRDAGPTARQILVASYTGIISTNYYYVFIHGFMYWTIRFLFNFA